MAFNTDVKEKAELYTGLAEVKVLAVNPDINWLVENGFRKNADKPVEYKKDKGNVISIYVETVDKKAKGHIDFFMPHEPFVSSNPEVGELWVDAQGNNHWGGKAPVEEAKFLNPETAVKGSFALQDLIRFVRTWERTSSGEDTDLNLEEAMKGNPLELQKKIPIANKLLAENSGVKPTIVVLFGVSNNYTTIYNKYFLRNDFDKSAVDRMKAALSNSFTAFETGKDSPADYQNSLKWQPYNPVIDYDMDAVNPDAEEEDTEESTESSTDALY
jgi:hypothetical protein